MLCTNWRTTVLKQAQAGFGGEKWGQIHRQRRGQYPLRQSNLTSLSRKIPHYSSEEDGCIFRPQIISFAPPNILLWLLGPERGYGLLEQKLAPPSQIKLVNKILIYLH